MYIYLTDLCNNTSITQTSRHKIYSTWSVCAYTINVSEWRARTYACTLACTRASALRHRKIKHIHLPWFHREAWQTPIIEVCWSLSK